MRRMLCAIVLAWVVLSGVTVSAADVPEYPCYRLAAAPVMNGKDDDAGWQSLPEAGGFLILGGKNYAIEKQTVFRAGWTDDSLYLRIKCFEPLPEKMKASADGAALWSDDSIEMFFQPVAGPQYFQLIANSVGTRWNSVGPATIETKPWQWEARPGKWEKGWLLEIRIPFSVLEKAPKAGESWAVNIARNTTTDPAIEHHTCWPPLQKGYNDLERFGRLVFSAEAPSEQQAKNYFKAQCLAKTKAATEQPELMAALDNPALAAESKPIKEVLAQLTALPSRPNADLKDLIALLRTWRKSMDSLSEKASQLNIPLFAIPKVSLVLEIKTRQVKDVKLWVNSQPSSKQADQWPVSIHEGLNVIAMTALADGQNPGLRLRVPGHPGLESRWRVGSAADDNWLTAAFDDRSWQKAALDKDGFLLVPEGSVGNICFRQIVLWAENHYSGLPCLQPKVREWGFSEKSMENLFHVLYSPPPLTFPLEDYEFVLDVPKGFSLLEEKYPDDSKGGKINRRPQKVVIEEVRHDNQPYRRYRFAFESKFIQNNQTQCALIPLLLNEYNGGDKFCKFYFQRQASGNLTELEQTLPVRILPPINGRMLKKVLISQYQAVPWLRYAGEGGGTLFPEHFEAHMRQSLDAGFNSWVIIPNDGEYGKKVYERVLERGGVVALWGVPQNYPIWGNINDPKLALAQLMQAVPEFRARFFNDTVDRKISGEFCRSYVSREGAAQFKEAVKKDIGWMLNGAADFKYIGFPKASIYMADWENLPWVAKDMYASATSGAKSHCFCENCKKAFRQYAKLADTVDLSDDAIFKNHKDKWSSFRNELDGRMNGLVREACNELGLKYMFYNGVHLKESFEDCKGKIDIAFPGWPGDGQVIGYGTQEGVGSFAVTQWSLDEVMAFFHDKVDKSQIMGQLFASAFNYGSKTPWHNWSQSAISTKDGFNNVKSLKSQILRIVAAFHGGVDLDTSLERCAGQQYYIGEATRLIAAYEDLFYEGKREDSLAASEQLKYPNLLVLTKGDERLVLLFNETGKPVKVELMNKNLKTGQRASVFGSSESTSWLGRLFGSSETICNPEKMSLTVDAGDVSAVHIK